jgi:hypothetical protein
MSRGPTALEYGILLAIIVIVPLPWLHILAWIFVIGVSLTTVCVVGWLGWRLFQKWKAPSA